MWHLLEDFFEQTLVMKGFIALGWLCVLIMLFSLGGNIMTEMSKGSGDDAAALTVERGVESVV